MCVVLMLLWSLFCFLWQEGLKLPTDTEKRAAAVGYILPENQARSRALHDAREQWFQIFTALGIVALILRKRHEKPGPLPEKKPVDNPPPEEDNLPIPKFLR